MAGLDPKGVALPWVREWVGAAGRFYRMVSQEPWLPLPQISGQLSPRLFRKLPPRVCVSLKNIVDEDFPLCRVRRGRQGLAGWDGRPGP